MTIGPDDHEVIKDLNVRFKIISFSQLKYLKTTGLETVSAMLRKTGDVGYVGDFMMVTDLRCERQNHYIGVFSLC